MGVQFLNFFVGVQKKLGVQFLNFGGGTKKWGSDFILGVGAPQNWGSNLFYFWGQTNLGDNNFIFDVEYLGSKKNEGPIFSFWVKKMGSNFFGGVQKNRVQFSGAVQFFYFWGPKILGVQ